MPGPADAALCQGLPPLVGLQVLVISFGLDRSHDRARGLDEFGYRVASCGEPAASPDFVHASSPDAIVQGKIFVARLGRPPAKEGPTPCPFIHALAASRAPAGGFRSPETGRGIEAIF